MKKYLLKFGLLTAALSPVVAIVSCSDDKDEVKVMDVDVTNLKEANFVIWGNGGEGTIGMNMSKKLPAEVEVRYNVGAEAPTEDIAYVSEVPATLSEDDKVHVKFFIKDASKGTHKFKEEVKFTKDVTGLTTGKTYIGQEDVSKLNADLFYFVGLTGSGNMGMVEEVYKSITSKNIIFKYRKGTAGSYSSTVPVSLSTDDKIGVEFSVDASSENMFPGNFDVKEITINVSLKTAIVTTKLTASSYVVSSGTLDLVSGVTLPEQVEAKYFKGNVSSVTAGDWKTALLTELTSESVYIKFFVKDAFKKTHAFQPSFDNPITINVT